MEIAKKLMNIQRDINVPKTQFNKFGNYNYRSAEDIIKAVKPLLEREQLFLVLTDEIVNIGEYNYIKAIASISDAAGDTITATGYAREDESRAGMSESQITGCASSYARKYALNGLFCIDDGVDADTFDNRTQNNGQNRAVNNGNGTGVQPGSINRNLDILKGFCGEEKNNPDTDRDELLKFFKYYETKMATWQNEFNPAHLWKRWMNNAQNKHYAQLYKEQQQQQTIFEPEEYDDNVPF